MLNRLLCLLLAITLVGCDQRDPKDVNSEEYALKQEKVTYQQTKKEIEVRHKQAVVEIKQNFLHPAPVVSIQIGDLQPIVDTTIPTVTPTITLPEPNTIVVDDNTVVFTAEEQNLISEISKNQTTPNIRNRCVCLGDNFPDTPAKLNFCVFDMQKSAVRHFQKLGFKLEEIRIITNKDLTAAGIKKWIAWAYADTKPGDCRGVFMSMHGAEDTGADGKIIQILVTYDMVSTNAWNADTEVEPGWISGQLSGICDGCNALLVMDLCHAGGVRPLLKANHVVKAIEGPDYVQKRVSEATTYKTVNLDVFNCTVIPMCGAGQLSEESSTTGGAGTWAFWRAVDKLGINARAVDVVKAMRIDLRANGFSQTPECHGKFALKPIYQN
jgi:hypothetical protein